jgi:tRNA(fMet)-specific endonuclease VapC
MFALDTNTVIYFFKDAGQVKSRLLATAPREVSIPAVALYELEVGAAQSHQPAKRRSQLAELLSVVAVLPFDEPAARRAAETAAWLHKAGTPIGPMDTLIAGTALAHGTTLVTHNVREFRRVRGLKIVDWY